jgi:Spy/CpxP family protein refolding chaperone
MKKLALCLIAAAALPTLAQTTNSEPAATTPLVGAGSTATTDDRREKLKEALAQLNLTENQQAMIRNIRASTSPGKERREQIIAVLTPDQKEKLKQMIGTWREKHDAAAAQ